MRTLLLLCFTVMVILAIIAVAWVNPYNSPEEVQRMLEEDEQGIVMKLIPREYRERMYSRKAYSIGITVTPENRLLLIPLAVIAILYCAKKYKKLSD